MNRSFERAWPGFLAAILTAILFVMLTKDDRLNMVQELSNSILNIFAIMVGFVATALAVLWTAQELSVVRNLRQTSHLNQLVEYHWAAICLGLLASLLSLLVIIVCKDSVQSTKQIICFNVWFFVSAWAFAAFFRVVYLLRALLRPTPSVS